MTVFLGTLCSSIKEVNAPFMFDGKYGIVLHAMLVNWASSHGEWDVSWFFSSCGGNLGFILQLQLGWPFKTRVCSTISWLLSSCNGHFWILLEAWHGNRNTSPGEAVDPRSLSSCHRYVGIFINF